MDEQEQNMLISFVIFLFNRIYAPCFKFVLEGVVDSMTIFEYGDSGYSSWLGKTHRELIMLLLTFRYHRVILNTHCIVNASFTFQYMLQ